MAHKQEQEDASPDVVEVAPNVLRMQLPIQMPGLGHVNMYCLVDDDGAAVVDPGLPGEETWTAIGERLAQADLEVRHVHTVLITHSHPDHFGGAGRFAAEAESRVIAHRDFTLFGRKAGEGVPEWSVEDLDAQRMQHAHHHDHTHGHTHDPRGPQAVTEGQSEEEPAWLAEPGERPPTPWGGKQPAPSPEQRARWQRMRASGGAFMPKVTHVVQEGSVLTLAGREWFVRHTPGHTADHICLHDPDEGIFLAGDHVLPSITPHISGLGDNPDPLQAFYDSLEEVGHIPDVQRCLPAHGHPFDDLARRASDIRTHHDERLERIKGISKKLGPATVEAFSHELFHERNWGPMAESETYAHLEHLRILRQAECHRDDDGMLIYVTD
ncbi:MAG: MBL fold metallo-hydrolase [Myxococcales bacterium]|nr:MBL fold metallo-hydrolase [Myxococcales bacterium]